MKRPQRHLYNGDVTVLFFRDHYQVEPGAPLSAAIFHKFIDLLADSGIELVGHHCKTEAELVAAVAHADAVITQFARVDANVIAAMSKACAIVRYGIGVDNVDLDAARASGIPG